MYAKVIAVTLFYVRSFCGQLYSQKWIIILFITKIICYCNKVFVVQPFLLLPKIFVTSCNTKLVCLWCFFILSHNNNHCCNTFLATVTCQCKQVLSFLTAPTYSWKGNVLYSNLQLPKCIIFCNNYQLFQIYLAAVNFCCNTFNFCIKACESYGLTAEGPVN